MGLFGFGRKKDDGGAANALAPISGVTLETYADLCARMARVGDDPDTFARIAEENGVARADWEAARDGWTARMSDPATAGTVAMAYMPLYQAALAVHGGPVATASLDDYIEMSAMINTDLTGADARPTDFEPMYARFGIDPPAWSQISTHWVDTLRADPALYAQYAERTRARVTELDAEHLRRRGG